MATAAVGSGTLTFPFVRIAGQEDLKLALMLNVVDPKIGGVLIMGDRGTGKSVSVELPLGATEDRICGTIDIERALSDGVRAFEPGLLARANRGILYVDEVNLLDDGLVDVILDSAASGLNIVEREGVSIQHPANFIMIGSGNPQEGELRPQLLDRFGLSVQVTTLFDRDLRTQIVLDRMKFDNSPETLLIESEPEQEALRQKLMDARGKLKDVTVSEDVKLKISEICSLLNVDGLRGDIVTNRAARAYVAYEGRTEVTMDDVHRVINLVVCHRLRKDPLDTMEGGHKVELAFRRVMNPKAAKEEEPEKTADKPAPQSKDSKRGNLKPGAWTGLKF
ncbi:unnamed protein product [Ostreobium quekettii]|uniref:magnesium chelatase n=1 Tax=Ostreobium quekettii TaxID=121088 RepID=A0A8S1IMK8_9CHLO|nr:unnamed protein product [Ostreobium quekettii]